MIMVTFLAQSGLTLYLASGAGEAPIIVMAEEDNGDGTSTYSAIGDGTQAIFKQVGESPSAADIQLTAVTIASKARELLPYDTYFGS